MFTLLAPGPPASPLLAVLLPALELGLAAAMMSMVLSAVPFVLLGPVAASLLGAEAPSRPPAWPAALLCKAFTLLPLPGASLSRAAVVLSDCGFAAALSC